MWTLKMAWNKCSKSRWLVPSLVLTTLVLGALPRSVRATDESGGIEKLPFCDEDAFGDGAKGVPKADRFSGKR